MKIEKMKLKDIITIALVGTVYFVVTFLLGVLLGLVVQTLSLSTFVLLISSGINALVCGTIVVFLAGKVGKFGMFLLLSLVLLAFNFIFGGATVPWIVGLFIGALLADLICARFGYKKRVPLAIAYATMLTVLNAGVLINTQLMASRFLETWTEQGVDTTQLENMVLAMQGGNSILILIIIFGLTCIGVLIGTVILSKHFKADTPASQIQEKTNGRA